MVVPVVPTATIQTAGITWVLVTLAATEVILILAKTNNTEIIIVRDIPVLIR